MFTFLPARSKHLISQINVDTVNFIPLLSLNTINSPNMTQVGVWTFEVCIQIRNTLYTVSMHILAIVMLLNLNWTCFHFVFFKKKKKKRVVVFSAVMNTDWLWCVLSRRPTTSWRCITSLMLFSLFKNRFLFKVCFIKDWQEKFVVSRVLMNINEWNDYFQAMNFYWEVWDILSTGRKKHRLWFRQASQASH